MTDGCQCLVLGSAMAENDIDKYQDILTVNLNFQFKIHFPSGISKKLAFLFYSHEVGPRQFNYARLTCDLIIEIHKSILRENIPPQQYPTSGEIMIAIQLAEFLQKGTISFRDNNPGDYIPRDTIPQTRRSMIFMFWGPETK